MPITDLSNQVNLMSGGSSGAPEYVPFYKDARVGAAAAAAPVAGRETSLWAYNGNPSHGADPSSALAPDNTTQGGLRQTDPASGRDKILLGGWAVANVPGTLIIYDRLRQIGGLSGTTTTAQTADGTAPTRYTNGLGNEIWIEITTQIGTTATTATCNYDDQDGNTQDSPAFAIGGTGLREAQRIIRVPLAAGDYGVRDVNNFDLVATTGTAGNIAVILAHPIATIACPAAGIPGLLRPILYPTGPLVIETDACLALAWVANGTTVPEIRGGLFFVDALE